MKYFQTTCLLALFFLLTCGCRHAAPPSHLVVLEADKPVTRIAFGSCLKDPKGGAILDRVQAFDPNVFIWLGDNVYIDTNDDLSLFKQRYDLLGSNPRFQKLRTHATTLAIWDDHDYGNNNVGMTYPLKQHSKEQFGSFWRVPDDEAFWTRDGIYRAYEYGQSGQRVQVILLDGRWFLDQKNLDKPGAYLGESQWRWLEEVLKRPAEVRLICSGVQVVRVNDEGRSWEMVGHHPGERQRLFDLVEKTQAQGVVFLSGDMHFAEIHRTTKTVYPLYDVTASGLDTVWSKLGKSRATGDYEQVGPGLLAENFGSIEIDWQGSPSIRLQVRDNKGEVFNEQHLELDQLQVR